MTNFNNAEWDESKHPRDNEGKFTFKNGGRGENIKDVLYGDERVKRKKEKEILKRKNELLNILDDKAKAKDVLYGTIEKLEEKIKKTGFRR